MPYKHLVSRSPAVLPLAVLAVLGGCADGSRYSSNAGQAPRVAATQPVVSPELVKQVQSTLRDGGYYKQGNIDGVWGGQTQTAVRAFQKDHSLNTSGELDVPTLQALNLAPAANAAPAPAASAPPATTAPAVTAPAPASTPDGQPPAR